MFAVAENIVEVVNAPKKRTRKKVINATLMLRESIGPAPNKGSAAPRIRA
jgi:hypothetical protein